MEARRRFDLLNASYSAQKIGICQSRLTYLEVPTVLIVSHLIGANGGVYFQCVFDRAVKKIILQHDGR